MKVVLILACLLLVSPILADDALLQLNCENKPQERAKQIRHILTVSRWADPSARAVYENAATFLEKCATTTNENPLLALNCDNDPKNRAAQIRNTLMTSRWSDPTIRPKYEQAAQFLENCSSQNIGILGQNSNCQGNVINKYKELQGKLSLNPTDQALLRELNVLKQCLGECPANPQAAANELSQWMMNKMFTAEMAAVHNSRLRFLKEICSANSTGPAVTCGISKEETEKMIKELENLIKHSKIAEHVKDEWRKQVSWLKANCKNQKSCKKCNKLRSRVTKLRKEANDALSKLQKQIEKLEKQNCK